MTFYELVRPQRYSGMERSGICFRTNDEARRALEGAVCILEEGYSDTKKNSICDGVFSVQEVHVSFRSPKSFASKLELFEQDNTEYEKLCEECNADLNAIHQKRHNAKVTQEKRKQYLMLAQGNEEIAKAFWAKTEGGEFPIEEAA